MDYLDGLDQFKINKQIEKYLPTLREINGGHTAFVAYLDARMESILITHEKGDLESVETDIVELEDSDEVRIFIELNFDINKINLNWYYNIRYNKNHYDTKTEKEKVDKTIDVLKTFLKDKNIKHI